MRTLPPEFKSSAMQSATEAEQSEGWKKISAIDFSMIRMKLCHKKGKGWTEAEADRYILKYKQWLYLKIAFPKSSHVPSEKIDEVWHYHILDTRAYERDCQSIFGHNLHHYPYFGLRGTDDAKDLSVAYISTQDLFRKVWEQEMSPDVSSLCSGERDVMCKEED